MEDCYLAKATERIFLPLLQRSPRSLSIAAALGRGVSQPRPRLHRKALSRPGPEGDARPLGSGQMGFAKAIFVLDAPIDLSEGQGGRPDDTRYTGFTPTRPRPRPGGMLRRPDHASPAPAHPAAKLGVDRTRKPLRRGPEGGAGRAQGCAQPSMVPKLPVALRETDSRITGCRLLFAEWQPSPCPLRGGGDRRGGEAGDHPPSPWIVRIARRRTLRTFRRPSDGRRRRGPLAGLRDTDPARDLFIKGGRVVIDATAGKGKAGARPWPEQIRMSAAMGRQVTARAQESGLGGMEALDESRYV